MPTVHSKTSNPNVSASATAKTTHSKTKHFKLQTNTHRHTVNSLLARIAALESRNETLEDTVEFLETERQLFLSVPAPINPDLAAQRIESLESDLSLKDCLIDHLRFQIADYQAEIDLDESALETLRKQVKILERELLELRSFNKSI